MCVHRITGLLHDLIQTLLPTDELDVKARFYLETLFGFFASECHTLCVGILMSRTALQGLLKYECCS